MTEVKIPFKRNYRWFVFGIGTVAFCFKMLEDRFERLPELDGIFNHIWVYGTILLFAFGIYDIISTKLKNKYALILNQDGIKYLDNKFVEYNIAWSNIDQIAFNESEEFVGLKLINMEEVSDDFVADVVKERMEVTFEESGYHLKIKTEQMKIDDAEMYQLLDTRLKQKRLR